MSTECYDDVDAYYQQQERMLRTWREQREHQQSQLRQSLTDTFASLTKEQPDQMEEDAIRRALELSMLDVALVERRHRSAAEAAPVRTPHDVLGVSRSAAPGEIRAAYRRAARAHHPDRPGGDSVRFQEVARAYRSLLSLDHHHEASSAVVRPGTPVRLKGTAHWDHELQDHRRLVQDLFQADGMDLQAAVNKQLRALELLGLRFRDAGSTNRNEQNELIRNSCFYLSLAASYLWGIGAMSFSDSDVEDGEDEEDESLLVGETALQLKRTIEAAVVKAHPEWAAQCKVGEEVQAFSDFLVYSLDSPTLLSDWAVVVFDACSGVCDVYKGQQYSQAAASSSSAWAQSNTITLRYIPGHYQPLIPSHKNARRPTLENILRALDDVGVFYVVTDGNS
jgi:hypothetical protein